MLSLKSNTSMSIRVLIVDDNKIDLQLLSYHLSKEYFSIFHVHDGQSAIDEIDITQPDVILMDVLMPQMDGFQATSYLKTHPHYMHIPIIIITTLDEKQDKIHGLKIGADDFITKPINVPILVTKLRSLAKSKILIESLQLHNKIEDSTTNYDEYNIPQFTDKSKIMIIDDAQSINESTMQLLAEYNLIIDTQHSHNTAIDKLLNDINTNASTEYIQNSGHKPYHLIILCQRRIEALLSLASKINSNKILRDIPIIALIDQANNNMKNSLLTDMLNVGIQDYMILPPDKDELAVRCITQIKKHKLTTEIQRLHTNRIKQAYLDHLSNAYNRKYCEEYIRKIIKNSSSNNISSTFFILLDIDNFKMINDKYGHASGDDIIIELPKRISRHINNVGICARWGGDEFAIILHDVTTDKALSITKKIMNSIRTEKFHLTHYHPDSYSDLYIAITCSMGGGFIYNNESSNELVSRVDKCLYRAKENGKNNIVIET